MEKLNNTTIPTHIAVIMDGNRRWAREQGLPVLAGHKKVIDDVLEPLIEHAAKTGVKFMTFWAWSTENWQRDKKEVEGIMKIFKTTLRERGNRLHERGVRVKIIGDKSGFDKDLQQMLTDLVEKTKNNTNITVVFALNYGGRDEIIRGINKYLSVIRHPSSVINNMSLDRFKEYLDTFGIPDPELIIRTGGEHRLSGFLLWQSEYSELYFPKWYMPEFTPDKLNEAMEEFNCRKRRFGK